MSEIKDSFAIARDLLAYLEERFTNGETDAEATRATLIKIVGALASHGRPTRAGKKPPRGYGYTFDEAQVVASLPWYKDNMSAAIRAQYPKANQDEINNHADRIRGRRAEIIAAVGDDDHLPWENSGNWLGDLIPD
jgi:hypothetical protein